MGVDLRQRTAKAQHTKLTTRKFETQKVEVCHAPKLRQVDKSYFLEHYAFQDSDVERIRKLTIGEF